MKKRKKLNGGYIGLLMLLIGVAIIIFIMFRNDIFSNKSNNEENIKKNMIETNLDYVDQAKDVKDMLEKKNQEYFEE